MLKLYTAEKLPAIVFLCMSVVGGEHQAHSFVLHIFVKMGPYERFFHSVITQHTRTPSTNLACAGKWKLLPVQLILVA